MRGSALFAGHFEKLIRLSNLLPVRAYLRQKMAWQCCMTGAVRGKSTYAPAPVLMAAPSRALIDEPIMLEARHLTPHCPVTLRAHMRCEEGDLWEALAYYYADSSGVLNLSRDEAQGGSYSGCEPMGLFWSLLPAPGGREGLRLRKKNVETPYTVQVSLLNGHVSSQGIRSHDEGQGKGEELASVTVERWYMAPGVRRIDIREEGLVGTMFLPPGPGPFPAVLDLFGMGGGLIEYRAALLASRGMASLALAYFGHKDIPGPLDVINVGDDYMQAAFQLLQIHPQVCSSQVAVIGLSFGVYLALRIATHLPVNPRCIIGINGGIGCYHQVVQVDEKVIRFGEGRISYSRDDPGYVHFKEATHPILLPPNTKVKVENLRCPLLLFTSEDDCCAEVLDNAGEIKERLQGANKSHLLTWVSYPGAGHLIEPPYSPHARTSLWTMRPNKLMVLWGGYTAPHAAAQEDAWKKILEFLECHLRGGD
ncbi:acyl-coenzyme A thioesterase 3-like [Conger conger]|nr:acyl-coenzyme A thioesterase 3-like [Conger conger]XP_061075684.1 acyl-coenzyme A thioesterase 3-like [Conger conger]XP_061075685.1 acyl-coenzyme A thioesterase 3-like [Conger conger]XP_061075686.1 acyl-coenzyme A thioesterase 3-like [Conger conger]XP_061075688.1 acyl-coenzyme A thioesterase 3-like [Conger conger]